ncbi:MAG TPA: alpha/beta family hydrolase [Candidatus Limnocylindrales bacterium]|nr:alpha/beta family hydrolase [Candidatus Limnocylindrales bacterium]
MRAGAVLAPGYGGTATQPILRSLAARLEAMDVAARPITFSTRGSRPSAGYARELDDLRAARDALRGEGGTPIALVGRSFGGRMCAFLAAIEPPAALVILSHPIAPPGRPRPKDEEALLAVSCPTLVVQGAEDELGPLPVLRRIAARKPDLDLVVIAGAGHDLGASEAEAVGHAARWLDAVLPRP